MLIKFLLMPFSALYGFIVGVRNFLYTINIFKSRKFDIPVICVGNITVGGTGKTPHTELIINILKQQFKIACLSRGYKRKTTGFILANKNSTARDVGDEPLQIKLKFPDIIVACDEDRARGIEKLMELKEKPDVIILDDAFQHRRVNAGINILLTDYNRPIYKDMLLPAGRLRETKNSTMRADYVIVSKCPGFLTPLEKRLIYKQLKIKPYQKLFFTTTTYGKICKLFPKAPTPAIKKSTAILCVTGIAQPAPYLEYLKKLTTNIYELHFPDHHHFSEKDIRHIASRFSSISQSDKYILTTEKDAVRLRAMVLPKEIKNNIYYIPIEPLFLNKKEVFISEIESYVRKNKR